MKITIYFDLAVDSPFDEFTFDVLQEIYATIRHGTHYPRRTRTFPKSSVHHDTLRLELGKCPFRILHAYRLN
jgi:hypothetical protein